MTWGPPEECQSGSPCCPSRLHPTLHPPYATASTILHRSQKTKGVKDSDFCSENSLHSCRVIQVCLKCKHRPYRMSIGYFPLAVCGRCHEMESDQNHCLRQICNCTFYNCQQQVVGQSWHLMIHADHQHKKTSHE